jgi:DNA-binding CsgD family transcriptional regulator
MQAAGLPRGTGVAPRGLDLTPTERQIAELTARGLTYREIGAKLYITEKTVGYHLNKVYRKLGVANRGELRRILEQSIP